MSLRGGALVVDNERFSFHDIDNLPDDITMEYAKQVQIEEGWVFQGRNRKITRNLGPGHNIPVTPGSDSETNPPMPKGDLPEQEDTDVHPVVLSGESPGRGTVSGMPSP